MNCARFEVAVHESLRGGLEPAEQAEIEAHASACPACAARRPVCAETRCRDLVEALPDLLEGSLPPEVRRRLDRHLELCPDCRAYRASYRTAIALTAAAFQGQAEPLPEELVRSILARRRGQGSAGV